MTDDWFLALVEMQKVQDKIDAREQYDLDSRSNVDLYGVLIDKPVKSKRKVGRPGTHIKVIEEVLRLFDTSVEDELYNGGKRLSLRAIEKQLDRRVGFLTIWKILKSYRASVFNDKSRKK